MSILKRFSLVAALLLCSQLIVHADSGRGEGQTLRYRISSKGLSVGEMRTTISPVQQAGERVVHFESDLSIDANLLLFRVNSNSREKATVGDHGTLRYHKSGRDNGKSYTVDGALEGDSFRFKVSENGVPKSLSVPRASYDYTTMDCPETRMQREGETMEIRLLSLEDARVVKRKFHWVRSEEIEVGGKRLRCRVIDFSDPDNHCRRWVNCDDGGVIILRQEGKGKKGSYTLRVVSLTGALGEGS